MFTVDWLEAIVTEELGDGSVEMQVHVESNSIVL